MKKIQLATVLIVLSLIIGEASAQGFNTKNRYWSYGGSINAMNYVGELDPGPSFMSPSIKFTRANLGLCAIYRMQPRFSIRGNVAWGRIKGSDAENANYSERNIYRRARNLHFRNDIIEVKADAIFDLFENRGPYKKRPDYTPYAFIGIAYFYHNPMARTPDGDWVALKPLRTDNVSYSLHQIAIPFGVGFRYKLSTHLDLAFEMGWRFTFTDFLDNVGTAQFVDKSTLGSDLAVDMTDRSLEGWDWETNTLPRDPELGEWILSRGISYDSEGRPQSNVYQPGEKKGDPNRDWYIVTGFHLTYIIPGKVVCPKFR